MPGCSAVGATPTDGQQKPGSVFQFEDVDCQANKPSSRAAGEHAGDASAAVEDLLLLDSVQSPLPAIKETGEIMAKLVLMYVVLEVAAGLVKGQSPVHHLLLAGVHLKLMFQAMLAPLSMMCSGFALALIQYSLLLKKQRGSDRPTPAGTTAATGGKSKAE